MDLRHVTGPRLRNPESADERMLKAIVVGAVIATVFGTFIGANCVKQQSADQTRQCQAQAIACPIRNTLATPNH